MGDVKLDKAYKIDFDLGNQFIYNMEVPISKGGIPAKNKVVLRTEQSYIEETFGTYPLAVNLANNHIMDYGDEAFYYTIDFLRKHNIVYFGAGTLEENCNNPAKIEYAGREVLLFGYCCESAKPVFATQEKPGSAKLDEDTIIKDIKKYKTLENYIILNLHWGDEHNQCPKYSDVLLARRFIDAGADLIIGHHPHVLQPVEIYKGKYIFYSLGHFLFSDSRVDAYFDGEKFTRSFYRKLNRYNRQGIVVQLDKNFNVSYFTIYFNKQKVWKKKINFPTYIPKSQYDFNEKQKFYKKRDRILSIIGKFLDEPKIPRLKHLKIFLKTTIH